MKIAVITPYYKEPIEFLRKCHESVLSQDIKVDHFFIADGFPNAQLMNWDIKHISLSEAHKDNGNTPRGIGALLASAEGYDFITFLDADNWFHPSHIHSMVELWKRTQADVCCSFTSIHTLDGAEMIGLQASDQLTFQHVDTSCFFIHKNGFDIMDVWLKMPKRLSPVCDRIFFAAIKWKNHTIAFTKLRTVAFRSQYIFQYIFGRIKTNYKLKPLDCLKPALDYLITRQGIKETKLSLGFYPLSYLKSRNIIFVSDFNSELSAIATIYLTALCTRRFIPYRAYIKLNQHEYPFANCLAKEMGLPEIDPKKNKRINEYQTNQSPKINYIVMLCEKDSKKQKIVFSGNPKIIFWEFSKFNGLDGNEENDIMNFRSQALEVESKIKCFFSLTDEELDAL